MKERELWSNLAQAALNFFVVGLIMRSPLRKWALSFVGDYLPWPQALFWNALAFLAFVALAVRATRREGRSQ